MGIFSKIMAMANTAENHYKVDSEQEAWVGILYTIMAADGEIKDVELDEVCTRLQHKTFFDAYDVTDLYHLASRAYEQVGGKVLIEKCAEKITQENKTCILTLAIDLMIADGHVDDEEKKFIKYLSQLMGVDELSSHQISEVLHWRNKYDKIRS